MVAPTGPAVGPPGHFRFRGSAWTFRLLRPIRLIPGLISSLRVSAKHAPCSARYHTRDDLSPREKGCGRSWEISTGVTLISRHLPGISYIIARHSLARIPKHRRTSRLSIPSTPVRELPRVFKMTATKENLFGYDANKVLPAVAAAVVGVSMIGHMYQN